MPVTRPYYRTVRSFVESTNSSWSAWQYMRHPAYAESPQRFIQGYLMIQKDLMRILEFVEADDRNESVFGYRIHELLMRACVEAEANFKAILKANSFTLSHRWTIRDYSRIDHSHRLSDYQVLLPIWLGSKNEFSPFGAWKDNKLLPWYEAYNASKHDRHESLVVANLEMLVQAIGGLVVLLTSQFGTEDYSGSPDVLSLEGPSVHKYEPSLGGLFRVDYPRDWLPHQLYDFDWQNLIDLPDPFQKFNYDLAPEVAVKAS
jgi:hypothetical protein